MRLDLSHQDKGDCGWYKYFDKQGGKVFEFSVQR